MITDPYKPSFTMPVDPPATTFPQLSPARRKKLQLHSGLAAAAFTIAAVLVWLVIARWHPAAFLPMWASVGPRKVVVLGLYTAAFGVFCYAVWKRLEGHLDVARTGETVVVPDLRIALATLAIALSIPIWPLINVAWADNSTALLPELAMRLAVLELPVFAIAIAGQFVLLWLRKVHGQLDAQQEQHGAEVAA